MDIAAGASFPPTTTPEVSGRPIPWTPRDVAIGIALFIGVFVVLPIPVAVPLALMYDTESRQVLGIGIALSAPIYLCVLWIATRLTFGKYGGGWALLGVARPTWTTVGWAAVALVGAFVAASIYAGLISYFNIDALSQDCGDQVPQSVRDSTLLLAMASVLAVMLAPPVEELFFRGFIFPGLARAWGPVAGIIASGVLFGSAHLLGNPALYKSMIEFCVIGMVFAFVYWRSGNIFSTMLAHFTFNLIGVVMIASTTCNK